MDLQISQQRKEIGFVDGAHQDCEDGKLRHIMLVSVILLGSRDADSVHDMEEICTGITIGVDRALLGCVVLLVQHGLRADAVTCFPQESNLPVFCRVCPRRLSWAWVRAAVKGVAHQRHVFLLRLRNAAATEPDIVATLIMVSVVVHQASVVEFTECSQVLHRFADAVLALVVLGLEIKQDVAERVKRRDSVWRWLRRTLDASGFSLNASDDLPELRQGHGSKAHRNAYPPDMVLQRRHPEMRQGYFRSPCEVCPSKVSA